MMFECPIHQNAQKSPHAPAIITKEKTYSYLECDKLATSIAVPKPIAAFIPGFDAVSILTFFACLRSQTIAYPISHRIPNPPKCFVPKIGSYEKKSVNFDGDAIATHIATSGTSGTPKIRAHSVSNHFYSALGSNELIPLFPGDTWRLSLPLFHVGGIAILFRAFIAGAAVTLLENATHLSLVPTQLRRLLGKAPSGIKRILLGGDIVPEELFKQALNEGLPTSLTYGLTEMSSQVATNTCNNYFTAGHPLPYRGLKIVDGEIYVRGKTLIPEYKEWYATGDLGKYGTEGLFVFGRKDRMFTSGGENIQPEEIERVLLAIPGVISAQVHPIDDREYGKRPAANLLVNQKIKKEELREKLLDRLEAFKVPTTYALTVAITD